MTTTRPSGRRTGSITLKLLLAAGAVAAGGAAIYGVSGPRQAKSAQSATSDIVTVAKTSFDITTTSTGELQAKRQIEIRSQLETETTIMELVPEGSFVKKGDVVVVLNSDSIQTKLLEEESRVESAKAELTAAVSAHAIQMSENESKFRQAELKLKLARLALDQWLNGDRVQELKDIELALDKTAKDLARLEEKYEQSVRIHSEGFLSKNELQLDEIALREARAARAKALLEEETYTKYQEPTDRAQKESDVAEAAAELERVKEENKSELASKEADLVNKRRQHQIRSDNVVKLRRQLEACTMRAPQDGLVVYATSSGDRDFVVFNGAGPLMVGRRVFPNETLVILPDTGEMIAQVRVHESLAGRVLKGQQATIKVEAAGGQVFSGEVDSIGILAEGGGWRDPNRREYTVKISLQNDRGVSLKPSMRCEATIVLGRVDNAVALPVQAVFTEDPVRFVYVPRGGKYTRVPVKVGQRSDTFAQVVSGVEAGERVLVRQPSPAEILRQPWEPAQLTLVGLKLDEEGKVVPVEGQRAPQMAGGGGGREGRGNRGGGPRQPGGERPEGVPESAPVANEPAVAERPVNGARSEGVQDSKPTPAPADRASN
jgi:HlyD family secretion protein